MIKNISATVWGLFVKVLSFFPSLLKMALGKVLSSSGIFKTILGIFAGGAILGFAKNILGFFIGGTISQYVKVGIVLGIVFATATGIGVIYMKGYYAAQNAERVSQLEANLAAERAARAREKAASYADAVKVEELNTKLVAYEIKYKELIDGLENPDGMCFDANDVERLRKLFE